MQWWRVATLCKQINSVSNKSATKAVLLRLSTNYKLCLREKNGALKSYKLKCGERWQSWRNIKDKRRVKGPLCAIEDISLSLPFSLFPSSCTIPSSLIHFTCFQLQGEHLPGNFLFQYHPPPPTLGPRDQGQCSRADGEER